MAYKVYYIILKDKILLSKRECESWKDIQNEYYDNFVTCLGPWTCEELICYFEDDFKVESKWPFKKGNLINFFEGNELILYSEIDSNTAK